jgi:integrase
VAVALFGPIFSFAVCQGIRPKNPVHRIVRFAEGRRLAWRRRRRDTRRSDSHRRHRMMTLTGWRRSEVLGLRWSEIGLPRRTARLADTKTGTSIRPLSEAASAVILSQPRNGDVVFDCGISAEMGSVVWEGITSYSPAAHSRPHTRARSRRRASPEGRMAPRSRAIARCVQPR